MIYTEVILVAGGLGTRFKSKIPKPFVHLKKKPLISHALSVFNTNKAINGIIVVGSKGFLNDYQKVCSSFDKVKQVVAGGLTRADSVKCGIAALDKKTTHVLVHDAARPFVTASMIEDILKALTKFPAAIVAVPVKATVKEVSAAGIVIKTPDRKKMWEVQTPQGFKRQVLEKAHLKPYNGEATDDAMLVEQLGLKVKVVAGNYRNIKITTPEDLKIGEAL